MVKVIEMNLGFVVRLLSPCTCYELISFVVILHYTFILHHRIFPLKKPEIFIIILLVYRVTVIDLLMSRLFGPPNLYYELHPSPRVTSQRFWIFVMKY